MYIYITVFHFVDRRGQPARDHLQLQRDQTGVGRILLTISWNAHCITSLQVQQDRQQSEYISLISEKTEHLYANIL